MSLLQGQYHPYCTIDWGNELSEQQCWMGDDKVALMDVNTENDSVVKAYYDWIGPFVKEYGIDGLRIDAARHIRKDFWQPFAEAAGVFVSEKSLRMTLQRLPSGKDLSTLF
jgi:alpha-amylase